MKTSIAVLALTLAAASHTSAETIFVAQSGTGNGSSCSSPLSVSFFNTSANWANPKQTGKIGPGDTVSLCGTITSNLTLQGSGSSGNYVVVDGQSATLGTSVGFNTNNKSWWTIRNVTWAPGANNTLFNIGAGSNGIVDNATADSINDKAVFLTQLGGIARADRITIRNSFFRTGSTDYGDSQHDIIVSEGSTNVIIEGNYLEMRAGGTGASAHDDVIQTWEKGGTTAGPPGDWTIRYNSIVMNSSVANDRSWTMLENLYGTINIYGNVFLGLNGAGSGNGLCANSSQTSVVFNIFNNTFVAKGNSSNNVINVVAPGTANIRNNVFHLQNQTALTGSMTKNRSYNLWYGTSIPSCSGITGEICGTDPLFSSYANNDFSLTSSSRATASGTDLGSGYATGIAAGSRWPGPTLMQRTGTWDRGAFVGSSATSSMPAAPSNLRISSSE
jgi:hypothetical protein